MNYTVESSFLEDDNMEIVLWAENILNKFIASTDLRLGLNKCNSQEKKVIKHLCKSFFLQYTGKRKNTFIEKLPDSRAPVLTFLDYMTDKKMKNHFSVKESMFFDNLKEFPKEFQRFKTPVQDDYPSMRNKKMTNKELEDKENQSKTSKKKKKAPKPEQKKCNFLGNFFVENIKKFSSNGWQG